MNVNENITNKMQNKFKKYLANYDNFTYGSAIVKNDEDCTLLQANDAYFKIMGHTKQEIKDKYDNRMAKILIDNVYPSLDNKPLGVDYDIEWDLRIRASNGEIRWIHDFAHYDTELNVFFVTVTDITDKLLIPGINLSYEAFQTKHEILSYLAKHTSEHIIVSDVVTDEVVYMNHMTMKLLDFHNESDWLSKTYCDVIFGSVDNIDPRYYTELSEDYFTIREYYNKLHQKYVHVESKIINIPSLNRKMRLNILTDITDKKRLEYKSNLHKTLHNCIDTLFTTATTNSAVDVAFNYMLKQLKDFYDADRAFFYKFKNKSYEVDNYYEIFNDDKVIEHKVPIILSKNQMELIIRLSEEDISKQQEIIQSLDPSYYEQLIKLHSTYSIKSFTCITVKNAIGDVVAFMGVTNPKLNEANKELMELLSRFICMFLEHQYDQLIKEEAFTLEALSKAKLIEMCTKNFQNLTNSKDNIVDTLDYLCQHYDADFALVLTLNNKTKEVDISYIGGKTIPNIKVLQSKTSYALKTWTDIFTKHSQFVTDSDIDNNEIKMLLKDNFGIDNFIVTPLKDDYGKLVGLLLVNNYKFLNRAHFMVHVVGKNISDYLDRLEMYEKTQIEPATQLANKVTTQEQISRLLSEGVRGSLFIIDIDNFKRLNDILGHHVGDKALIDYARILKQIFRSTDIVGRVGGDEFMVFSPGLIISNVIETKLKQVLSSCKKVYTKNGISVEISVSVGVCSVNQRCKTFQPLYENADYALYVSKKSGKNQYHIYSNTEYMKDATGTEDLRFYPNVVKMLKYAIVNNRFVVHYQPLYHVPTDTFTQAEALVRILNSDGKLIYPNEFIQVADTTGLVVDLTYQVLEQVCMDFRRLLNNNPKTTLSAISVNVPYLQFTNPDMEDRFIEILSKYNISPKQIKLEITERTIISDMEIMMKKMKSMMKKGFIFELDDFGMDYSNLQTCISLPLKIIKLDRSILLSGSTTSAGRHFFGHVLAGLHESGRITIMEGVETQEQLDWAKECKCEFIQGYFFSKPVDFTSFIDIIEKNI